ncbi:3-isopropylmalate dehydratase small subunit [Prosthecomicrobium hirschii]|uniref:3-isopropylmalate dehydratase small subunit n=1 Tax=Prosthecodimorpha hirschii TaxID=665126 RepID=UPI0011284C00|nr:3-isopropylmalate dehydratase small subunit [Prosthecomicrobium hirschii]TPQ51630.1 3-isopropylmalate dehydratase small subunit [Prosthecomicrobium hirschii]
MQPFTRLEARACPLGLANVDTDQLIPARFMSRPRTAGYGTFLLHDLRFGPDGAPVPGFVLDDPRRAGARILVARRNFGTGSSREAAVYALVDYGIACVIAPSFGDIFASNAVKNGLLPATVTEDDAESLLAAIEAEPETLVGVDLTAQTIAAGDRAIAFAIDPVRRLQLLNGWDDIDLTLRHAAEIAAFARTRRTEAPWIIPSHGG